MKRLICFIFDHKLYVKKEFEGGYARCVGCRRCGEYFAMNDDVRIFVPWSGEFTVLHEFNPYKS